MFSFVSAGGDIGGSSDGLEALRGAAGLFKDLKARPLAAVREVSLLDHTEVTEAPEPTITIVACLKYESSRCYKCVGDAGADGGPHMLGEAGSKFLRPTLLFTWLELRVRRDTSKLKTALRY